MEVLYSFWSWYVAGPVIALVMVLMTYYGKRFGVSSSLETACSILGAGKVSNYFRVDWKTQKWNLIFILGAFLGGFISQQFLMTDEVSHISVETAVWLTDLGFQNAGGMFLPEEIFALDALSNPKVLLLLVLGGLLVGFGTRYAGGCTSGHAISGLSNLQLPSLVAVIGFFIGGLLMVHLIFPLIFPL
ncbi:MAG: YeeE/YedE family protein [Bacteroidetes bacterium]|nr:YeeE/YedE family protein [Bacteroidota bacterium]